MQDIVEYFECTEGLGLLATAAKDGKVNAAPYAKPRFADPTTVAFVMADRLTHKNVVANPHACYIFIAEGAEYDGRRLYLTCVRDEPLKEGPTKDGEAKFLTTFRIDTVLPLVSEGEKKS